jgi:hypothetical protein
MGWTGSSLGAGENPDFFQSTGKIYVVVAVIGIVFCGLAYYLYRLDRRLQKLEKQKQNDS